jgi:hypothetical protein
MATPDIKNVPRPDFSALEGIPEEEREQMEQEAIPGQGPAMPGAIRPMTDEERQRIEEEKRQAEEEEKKKKASGEGSGEEGKNP